jgi:AraC family transcriptional regulator
MLTDSSIRFPGGGGTQAMCEGPIADPIHRAVEVYPSDIATRRSAAWDGMAAEVVRATRRGKLELRFRAPLHLLAVCDRGMRSDGDTFVEGLPRSRLHDLTRKLIFVPAGHEYREWHEPRVLTRIVYFYFDPARMPSRSKGAAEPAPLVPRLFFEDAALSNTALKLKRLIENSGAESGPYFGALGAVLAHELIRFNAGASRVEAPAKGGLAPGRSASRQPISRIISPSRYRSRRWRGWSA